MVRGVVVVEDVVDESKRGGEMAQYIVSCFILPSG